MELIAYLTMFIDHIVKFLAPNYYSRRDEKNKI